MSSPTQRTLEALRKQGYVADVVERRIQRFTTKDLFGIGDVLAIDAHGTLLVQATSDQGGNHSGARIRKVTTEGAAMMRAWLSNGGRRFEIYAWRKLKPKPPSRQQWFAKRWRIDLFYGDDPAGELVAVPLDTTEESP